MKPKKAYEQKLQAKLDLWKAEIDKQKAKARMESADSQAAYRKRMEELDSKYAEANAKLGELKLAAEGAWVDFKHGIENAFDDMSNALDAARREFQSDERASSDGKEKEEK